MILLVTSLTTSLSYAGDKILIVLTSHAQMGNTDKKTGFWLAELTHPYYVIKDAGYEIDIVSITGGKAPIDPRSLDETDPDNKRFLNDAGLLAKVNSSKKLADALPENYQAILFSGGHGTMWDFPNNPDINRITAAIYQNNGVVAAVCHGPAALTDVKLNNGEYLISGKKFAAFTNEEEDEAKLTDVVPFLLQDKLIERGGKHVYASPWKNNVVADQRIITGQNPQSAHSVGKLIVEELKK